MRNITLVRGARQLLTLQGPAGPRRGPDAKQLNIIQDGAVLVVDGVIDEVGSTRRLENLAVCRAADEIDGTGRVVMPGFIDSHTHIVGGPARFQENEIETGGTPGILALARAIQQLSPRTLETQAAHAIDEAVRHGTTTLEAKSGFGLIETGELKILRVHAALQKMALPLVSTFLVSHVPPDYTGRSDDYIAWICSHALPALKRRKLVSFVDIRCDAEAFTTDQARRYLLAARGLGFGLKLHAGRHAPPGLVQLATEIGVTSVDQLIEPGADDIRRLSKSNTIATLLPGPEFYSGMHHYPAARTLADGGAALAIASNYNPLTSPSQSMQMVIALACRQMNMTPAEAITASTMNAAHALGMADRIGSLEIGKSADLLILSVPDYREIPYHFGVNLVDVVMKRGSIVARRSEVAWPAV
jgi:imidazolonepropionase